MNVNDIINSVGAMAEITAIYYKTLVKNGINGETAAFLTSEFLKTMIEKRRESEEE